MMGAPSQHPCMAKVALRILLLAPNCVAYSILERREFYFFHKRRGREQRRLIEKYGRIGRSLYRMSARLGGGSSLLAKRRAFPTARNWELKQFLGKD
jgi:hypothetical protein